MLNKFSFREWMKLPVFKQLVAGLAIGLIAFSGVIVRLYYNVESRYKENSDNLKSSLSDCQEEKKNLEARYNSLENRIYSYLEENRKQRDTTKKTIDSLIKKVKHE